MPDGSSVTRRDATEQSLAQLAAGSSGTPFRAGLPRPVGTPCSGTHVSRGLWPGEVETPGLTGPTHPTLGHTLQPQGLLELPWGLAALRSQQESSHPSAAAVAFILKVENFRELFLIS